MFASLDEPIWKAKRRAEELIRQGLIAKHCYLRGHQYQIVDGRVVIVDEYTGRFLADRNWKHGLHQAVRRAGQRPAERYGVEGAGWICRVHGVPPSNWRKRASPRTQSFSTLSMLRPGPPCALHRRGVTAGTA